MDHLLLIAGAALPWDLLDEMTAHLPGTSRRHTAFLKAMAGVDPWRSGTQRLGVTWVHTGGQSEGAWLELKRLEPSIRSLLDMRLISSRLPASKQ